MLSDTSFYHASRLSPGVLPAVATMLEWDENVIFPVVDLLRLLAIHPNAADQLAGAEFALIFLEVTHFRGL